MSAYYQPLSPSTCRLLAQKNLPAAIEDTGGNQLPESISTKAAEVQSYGGLSSLDEKFYGLPELLTRNKEILSEVSCHSDAIDNTLRVCPFNYRIIVICNVCSCSVNTVSYSCCCV